MRLEIISEKKEKQLLHYFCIISNNHRYDLTIGYSEHFFGKAMVTSIQSGNLVLLCQEDTDADYIWASKLGIHAEDIPDFKEFFGLVLQTQPYLEQY